MAQHACAKIGLPAERIDELALLVARHGVDRQVAAREILGERDVGRREEFESAIAAPVLALRTGERVLLAGIAMEKDREVAAHRLVTGGDQDLGRRADDDPVPIDDGAPEELVAHRASDAVDLHLFGRAGLACHASHSERFSARRARDSRRIGS